MSNTSRWQSVCTPLLAALAVASASSVAETPGSVGAVPADTQFYVEREFQFVEAPEIQTYLDALIDKLLQSRTDKYTRPHLRIVSEDLFDGRSDENGNLIVSTETLRSLESEDELAALLSHELAHVVLKHPAHKSLLSTFPGALETMAELAVIGDAVARAQKQKTAPTQKPSKFADKSLLGSQSTAEFWSDILTTNFNRKQEREADRVGFDMMLKAGYDPAAFTTLFSKLNTAELKRGKLMDALRQKLIARAQAITDAKLKTNSAATGTEAELTQAVAATAKTLADAASQKLIDTVFDNFAKITADYDSPQQRQESLAKYASEQPTVRRDKTARSQMFAQVLREGAGGTLLVMDNYALQIRHSLQTADDAAANEAGTAFATQAGLIAESEVAQPKPPGNKKPNGKSSTKNKTPAPSQPATIGPRPVSSPYLNAAATLWFEMNAKKDQADQQLVQWLSYSLAPPSAFVAHADYLAEQGDYQAAIATLEDGARREGSYRPFLVPLVNVSKAANDMLAAEKYTRRCDEVQHKDTGWIKSVVMRDSAPTGLYADCVEALGHIPATQANGGDKSVASAADPNPVRAFVRRLSGGDAKSSTSGNTATDK